MMRQCCVRLRGADANSCKNMEMFFLERRGRQSHQTVGVQVESPPVQSHVQQGECCVLLIDGAARLDSGWIYHRNEEDGG